MTIYLGEGGFIELQRENLNTELVSALTPDDVNVEKRRFSFDFDVNALITGDYVEIGTVDGSDLELVDGHVYPDGSWFINVDEVGGIRLYSTFALAVTGGIDEALELVTPTGGQTIYVKIAESQYRCIAQVKSFTINTTRETVDITELGDDFRRNYANGLIQGQGTVECFWDYKHDFCDPDDDPTNETPHNLAKLVMRTQLGGSFLGHFYLHSPRSNGPHKDYVWYEARCIITNCAMSVVPTEPITTAINFVTSGPFRLHVGTPSRYLLQESGLLLLQESGDGILLEDRE